MCDWWSVDLAADQRALVSPRKLEHMARLIRSECDPEDSIPHKDKKLPFHLLHNRIKAPHAITDLKDFVSDPDTYLRLVKEDPDMAMRFAQVFPAMKPLQMVAVRMILLELPGEYLAQANHQPATFKKLYRAITTHKGAAECQAFRELIEERLKEIPES